MTLVIEISGLAVFVAFSQMDARQGRLIREQINSDCDVNVKEPVSITGNTEVSCFCSLESYNYLAKNTLNVLLYAALLHGSVLLLYGCARLNTLVTATICSLSSMLLLTATLFAIILTLFTTKGLTGTDFELARPRPTLLAFPPFINGRPLDVRPHACARQDTECWHLTYSPVVTSNTFNSGKITSVVYGNCSTTSVDLRWNKKTTSSHKYTGLLDFELSCIDFIPKGLPDSLRELRAGIVSYTGLSTLLAVVEFFLHVWPQSDGPIRKEQH